MLPGFEADWLIEGIKIVVGSCLLEHGVSLLDVKQAASPVKSRLARSRTSFGGVSAAATASSELVLELLNINVFTFLLNVGTLDHLLENLYLSSPLFELVLIVLKSRGGDLSQLNFSCSQLLL